jgi:hypothetical protein
MVATTAAWRNRMPDITSGDTQFLISDDDQTYILAKDAVRTATGNDAAIRFDPMSSNTTLGISGQVSQIQAFAAIGIFGANNSVQVATSGVVSGNTGIAVSGENCDVVNAGKIIANENTDQRFFESIYCDGNNAEIVNNGEIIGNGLATAGLYIRGHNNDITDNKLIRAGLFGIWSEGDHNEVTVGTEGVITAKAAAIHSDNSDPLGGLAVTNWGTIQAMDGGYAIQVKDSAETIVNHGVMHGKIDLGGGDDFFDNRGGHLDHGVVGGMGDDTLLVSNVGVKLIEHSGGGFDAIKSTVSYRLPYEVETLTLLGKRDINAAGNDLGNVLTGNPGDNRLTGFDGFDQFVFKTRGGHDTITDFDLGVDKIDLSQWKAISSVHDLMHNHAVNVHGDVVITAGHDQLTVEAIHKDQLPGNVLI